MVEIFQKIISNHFSDLAGLTVDASIPVPQYIVNEVIEAVLRGDKNIKYCRVSISEQNRVSAKLKSALWPWPLRLKMKLENTMDLTSSPKMRASLENHVLIAKIGSFLKALPHGVSMNGNQVVVDIESFLLDEELKNMLDLIKSVEIRTEEGKAIFDVKIRAEQKA